MKTKYFFPIKHIILSCLILPLSMQLTYGQNTLTRTQIADDYKREFKLGYGVASVPEFAFAFVNVIGVAIGSTLGLAVGDIVSIIVNGQRTNVTITRIEDKSHLYGTFQVGYNRFVNKRLSLGVQASYTPIRFNNIVYYSNNTTSTSTSRADFAQLFGRLDFHYIQKPRFQMYSGIMAGGLYVVSTQDFAWAAHANLLGFRFGKSHAFYTELGFGFSSTLTAGYSAKF